MSATILPPLQPGGNTLTQRVLESIPQDKNYDSWKNPVKKRTVRQNSLPGRDQNAEKSCGIDTAKYRNSFLHNVCVEMLKDGFHLAFRELFALIKSEDEFSEDSSVDQTEVALKDCPEKVLYIKDQLIAAELARRQGYSDQIYDAQLLLSKYFEDMGRFRLAQHFYEETFATSKQIRGDGRKKEAIANFNLGKVAERDRQFALAQEYYQEYHMLTENKNWKTDEGETLHKHARDCLTSVLITLSNELPAENETEVLQYLHKAYDLVKQSDCDDANNIGYLLGSRYDFYGHHEKAIQYLTEYLHLCTRHLDNTGIGNAYQALAYSHQRQANMDEAAENLKMYLEVMEKCGDPDALREACSDLGALYNYVGNYEQSSKYFRRAFELCASSDSVEVESSRCEYGISLAHGLFSGQVESITSNSKLNTSKLLQWKSQRVQKFSNDSETYSMYNVLS